MDDCLFCKISQHDIPSDILMETDDLVAFNDINPQAPVHILIIPKKHITTLNDLTSEDAGLVGKIILAARTLAREKGIADEGYRTVFNCNRNGGQAVYHIHLHLLGGRAMNWPPG
ncbi:MAG: histidine triad nucleotide-binding protein [Fidelibacterota bacterium]